VIGIRILWHRRRPTDLVRRGNLDRTGAARAGDLVDVDIAAVLRWTSTASPKVARAAFGSAFEPSPSAAMPSATIRQCSPMCTPSISSKVTMA
jgi:hypothetical protein